MHEDPDANPPPPTTDTAVLLAGLQRTFAVRGGPDRVALGGVDLRLSAGGVHGLLGPNGAGKTTICRIISTVLLPTAGRAEVLGNDVVADAAQVRRSIGIVFGGERGLYGRLSAAENLRFWCAMYGIGRRAARLRVAELLERLGLADRADVPVETFSRGMKQRLHLARGLVPDPPLLILDEPTVGMDPVAAHDFRSLIGELRGEGRTILLTTHDMAEAEAVCDSVTFIDAGAIVGSGTPGSLRSTMAAGHRIRIHDVAPGEPVETLRRRIGSIDGTSTHYDSRGRNLDVGVAGGQQVVGSVMAAVLSAGYTSLTTAPPSLEDVYLGLLGTDRQGPRGMEVR